MVETAVGMFEIIKDEKNAFVIIDFEKKYVDILSRYEYIVGDYSQNILRLKGFSSENAKYIPDYINEYCSIDMQYYILKNPNFDSNKVIDEE